MDFERYQRQIQVPTISVKGQELICKASVLIVGLGGLGCPAALNLVGAGLGKIGLVDGDKVSLSNLHRQHLYNSNDVGQSKVAVARKKLHDLNPEVNIIAYDCFIEANNLHEIAKDYDYILDGSDRIDIRYLLDEYCASQNKKYVYGSVYQFEGQVALFNYKENGSMYKFLFPTRPNNDSVPSCSEHGILPFIPSIIGSMQAQETIKDICQLSKANTLVHYNALQQSMYSTELPIQLGEKLLTLEQLKNFSIQASSIA